MQLLTSARTMLVLRALLCCGVAGASGTDDTLVLLAISGRSNTSRLSNSIQMQAYSPIDWRARNVVTRPKDQGQTENCWAYAVAAAIESRWMIHKGTTTNKQDDLANSVHPDQFVHCKPKMRGPIPSIVQYQIDGPMGGFAEEAIWWAAGVYNECGRASAYYGSSLRPGNDLCMYDDYDTKSNGCGKQQALGEDHIPVHQGVPPIVLKYCSVQQSCKNKIPRGYVTSEFDLIDRIVSHAGVPDFGLNEIKRFLQDGPITAAICDSDHDPGFDRDRAAAGKVLYESKPCGMRDANHVITIVGWNTTKTGHLYWIIKNSWGDSWGAGGFAYVGQNDFGIRRMISVPKINKDSKCTPGATKTTEYVEHQEPGVVYHKLNLRAPYYARPDAYDWQACQQWCISDSRCRTWTFFKGGSWNGPACNLHDKYDSLYDTKKPSDHWSGICRP